MRNSRRTDHEWLAIITEARKSGLSDREWCELHNISRYSFYNAVGRLRKKACEIPEAKPPEIMDFTSQRQEVVQIGITDGDNNQKTNINVCEPEEKEPAISICFSGCTINISNTASPALISSMMSSLRGML